MIKNNLLAILRSFQKSKLIILINILGLSVGLVAAILLIVLLKYEYSFDSFHENKETLHRVLSVTNNLDSNENVYFPRAPSALNEYLKEYIPGFNNLVTVTTTSPRLKIDGVLYNDKSMYVDENFLRNFSFDLVQGSLKQALSKPDAVILTKSFAQQLFGNSNAYQQSIIINEKNYTITGIIEDVPANSSIQFSALFPIKFYKTYKQLIDSWGNNLCEVYINLPGNKDRHETETLINRLTKIHERKGALTTFALQPLSRMHLYSKSDFGIEGKGNATNLFIYTFFVIFLLTTSIINYSNISFNQIYKRSNEAGMRRILGASKSQIFFRSWAEAVIICLISFVISLQTVSAILPEFNELFDRRIEFSFVYKDILEIGLILLVVSILLGLMPTLKLLKISRPLSLRRGVEFTASNKPVKGMLITQFVISFFFLITALLVTNQLEFISYKHSIKDNESIIHVRAGKSESNMVNKSHSFYNSVLQNSVIVNSTYSEGIGRRDVYKIAKFSVFDQKEYCYIERFEKNHVTIFNRNIIKGRDLDIEKFPADTNSSIVVNEAFLKLFDITKPFETFVSESLHKYRIVGIIEDYSIYSLKHDVQPLVLLPVRKITDYYFKVNKQNEETALKLIEKNWNEYYPNETFTYLFYDETIMADYRDEIVAYKLFMILAVVSISISLLGTVGLISIILIKKKKEIAIRKILGASIRNLVGNFSKEFLAVIVPGFVLASVISYVYINEFLEVFVYKASIDVSAFIIALALVLSMVLILVTIQSLKYLYKNPVDSLVKE